MQLDSVQEPLNAEIDRKNAADQERGPHFVRACAVEMQSEFIRKFTGKMLPAKTGTRTLCEPAQSKCTW